MHCTLDYRFKAYGKVIFGHLWKFPLKKLKLLLVLWDLHLISCAFWKSCTCITKSLAHHHHRTHNFIHKFSHISNAMKVEMNHIWCVGGWSILNTKSKNRITRKRDSTCLLMLDIHFVTLEIIHILGDDTPPSYIPQKSFLVTNTTLRNTLCIIPRNS